MRLAAIDRALAGLQQRRRHSSTLTPTERKALCEQIESVRVRRDLARLAYVANRSVP
jgi:hypothetical protein